MSKIQYMAIKEKDKPLRIVNNKLFREELNNLSNGRYMINVDKYRKNKSLPQLGYYYACVLPMFLNAAIDAGWELTSREEADTWLKSMFAGKDLINKHTGQIIEVPGLKRNMTTVEMLTFINQVRDYAAEYLGTYIPDPEVNLKLQLQ